MLHNVHEALDEMREPAWRIYPSALLHGDLGDALRATSAGIPVSAGVLPTKTDAQPSRV
jgi:hypothetical protein